MGGGGLGAMLMIILATAFGLMLPAPVIVVAMVREWRGRMEAWCLSCLLSSLSYVWFGTQIRVEIGGPNLGSSIAFVAALVFALFPIAIMASRFRTPQVHWVLAVLPLFMAGVYYLNEVSFRDRSERLISAIHARDVATARKLLSAGADADCSNSGRCVKMAIRQRDWAMVEALIEFGATTEVVEWSDGWSPTSAEELLDDHGKHDLARRLRANPRGNIWHKIFWGMIGF